MKNAIFIVAAVLLPTLLGGQSLSSFLQSGIVLGTERERHFSMRIKALGRDFSGLLPDQITDLYRNPAFFHRTKTPILFGELVRQPAGLETKARFSYTKTYGVLLRGNYENSALRSGGPLDQPGFDTDKDRAFHGEAQFSLGFPLSERLSSGASYTYGTNEFDYLRSDGTSSSYYTDLTSRDNNNTDRAHVARFGLIWDKAEGKSWDAVATVERFSADGTYLYQANKSQTFNPQSSNRQYSLQDARVRATNLRLALRFLNASQPEKTFAAQFSAGVAFFSENDQDYSSSYSQSVRMSSFDTSETITTASLDENWAADGFGFQLQSGAGWSWHRNNFLFAVAALGNFRRVSYDDRAQRETVYTQTLRTSKNTYTWNDRRQTPQLRNDYTVSYYGLAAPVGIEYNPTKGLQLRAGWKIQFLGRTNERSSSERSWRSSYNYLDTSTVTFGLGYQIFDQLRADLVNFGNLSEPRNWNLAIIYSFQ